MINLTIDIGNSRTKLALFENSVLADTHSFVNQAVAGQLAGALKKMLGAGTPDNAILASVTDPDPALLAYLDQRTQLFHFPGSLRLPLVNKYLTPASLGADRLAAVIGAQTYGVNADQLVIVAGTCITYNFLNSRGEFLGGAISPGLHMRLQAMHTFTDKLPLITVDEEYDEFLGRDTRQSLLAGAQTGSLAEMQQMIGLYLEQYPGLKVFLCGGDAEFFDKRLKNSIFAHRVVLDRELILKGLDRVLNYQHK